MKEIQTEFDKIIKGQEIAVRNGSVRFDDETNEQFTAKVERRIKMICVIAGHAKNFPGINSIEPYCNGEWAEWNGYKVMRRKADQLDNVYIMRA